MFVDEWRVVVLYSQTKKMSLVAVITRYLCFGNLLLLGLEEEVSVCYTKSKEVEAISPF